jgi:hypothetical protein
MPDLPGETLDRLLAGELSAEEQRRLARAAVDDPVLFDQLTAAGVVATALPARPARRRRVLAIAALASAAAIVLAVVVGSRARRAGPEAVTPATTPGPAISTPSTVTTLAAPPVLLTMSASSAKGPAGTFRSDVTGPRDPRMTGTVTSLAGDIVELDLGSVDGVRQGAALTVYHGTKRDAPTGRVIATIVFRDESRARVPAGTAIATGDRIDVAPDVHVAALLESANAHRSIGDTAGAETVIELAARRVQTLQVAPPLRADALNELAAIQIDRRDYAAAELTLHAAETGASGITKIRITNNLGALAALQGDRASAEKLYRSARALAADSAQLAAERAAIDQNLDTLARSR